MITELRDKQRSRRLGYPVVEDNKQRLATPQQHPKLFPSFNFSLTRKVLRPMARTLANCRTSRKSKRGQNTIPYLDPLKARVVHSSAHLFSLKGISCPRIARLPSSSALQAQYSPNLVSAYDA